MTCEELVELLLDFYEESLPAEQVALIKEHMCGCPPCSMKVETYRITIRVARALPKTGPLPPTLEQRFQAALAGLSADGSG